MTINRLIQAPWHPLHPNTNKCHNGNDTHQSITCCYEMTSTKSRTRGLFSVSKQVTTSAHNKQQAQKHRSANYTRRSPCQEPTQGIMSAKAAMKSTKARTRMLSQQTTTRSASMVLEDLTVLPRTNTAKA